MASTFPIGVLLTRCDDDYMALRASKKQPQMSSNSLCLMIPGSNAYATRTIQNGAHIFVCTRFLQYHMYRKTVKCLCKLHCVWTYGQMLFHIHTSDSTSYRATLSLLHSTLWLYSPWSKFYSMQNSAKDDGDSKECSLILMKNRSKSRMDYRSCD